MSEASGRNCTVLFADVCGSTQLYERVGDAIAKECVVGIEDFMAGIVAGNGGRLVETVGDEILCEFSNADDAIAAATAIQVAVAGRPAVHGIELSVRIGIHSGEVLVEGARMFGDTLNTAARVAAIAHAQQIITTEATVAQIDEHRRQQARRFDRVMVKGKSKPLELFQVLWGQEDVTRIRQTPRAASGGQERSLMLRFPGGERRIGASDLRITIGRGENCDVVLESEVVSRVHVRIDFVRGKFVLADQSTNGTWVRNAGGEDVFLRRETLPLTGEGLVSLGRPIDERDESLLRFLCT